ncbi:MAG: SpoIID/LytB domain-containing protein [Candidatus Omnitrophica bacterium]|nr:SpoIID/LytB domain-containing protein [Candidatus Omnitrophota bacterium]
MFSKIKRILFFVVISFLLLADARGMEKTVLVRVAVLREADHFIVYTDGRYSFLDSASGQSLSEGVRLRPAMVMLAKGKLKIGETVYDKERIVIEPRKDAMMGVNNMHFRGSLTIINNGGKNLTVVNSIELEQYIRGVLYHEISDKWPLEAIKAQAVATRTFALYSLDKFAARDYDMTNDIYSQVYGGRSAERYRTNLAVRRTKGEVLMYKGKIFPAFFHANSGGITEDAAELWGIDLPPLKGNIVSPFSIDAPHYRWKVNLRLKDIQDKLNARGYHVGTIEEIKILERDKSGRIRKLMVVSHDATSETLEGKVFRDIIGPNILKSNKYDVEMKGWYVDFAGYGWGHGVGMCQWGAYGMAKKNYDYKAILSFYYPSSDLVVYPE